MHSNTSFSSARRVRRAVERRIRRRPALIAGSLAFALLAAAGLSTTAPASQAEASGSYANFALASFTMPAEPIATVSETGTDSISTAAREALATADASLTASATVTADIAGSGLDLGVADTTVDTTELEAAVERLENAESLPAPLVPRFTDAVIAQVATIDERVAGLQGSLDAAKALKAQQEAEEKARREAEAAAAAAAEAEASAPSAPVYATGGSGGDNSPAGAQATARGMLAGYGWGDDQFSCLVSLWNKESGWNYQAYNQSSGAFGIPQALPGSKMASAGADWQSNAGTQVAWGLGYISGRYGSPCGAWSHSQSVGWY